MSMTDVERPRKGNLAGLYRNQFLQHAPELSEAVLARLSAAPAMLIREHCTMGLGNASVCLVIETTLAQYQPWIWQFHRQRVSASANTSKPKHCREHRRWAFASEHGPRLAPIFECMGQMLTKGKEGRDWELLQHVPCCDATRSAVALSSRHHINPQQDALEQVA